MVERVQEQAISIHAPAKGATPVGLPLQFRLSYFNPRSREGSDGDRRKRFYEHTDFNPRSREGSDRSDPCNCTGDCRISIHAPAKGATAKEWQFTTF